MKELNETIENYEYTFDQSSLINDTNSKYVMENLSFKPKRQALYNINQKYSKLYNHIIELRTELLNIITISNTNNENLIINKMLNLRHQINKLSNLVILKEEILLKLTK